MRPRNLMSSSPIHRVAILAAAMLLASGGATGLAQQANTLQTKKDLPNAPSPAQASSTQNVIELLNRRSSFFPDLARAPGALDAKQKLELFAGSSISGYALFTSAFSAGFGQATDSLSGYGQGADGYAKRLGSSMARGATSNFVGTFLLPTVLHQDPRFFVLATDSPREATIYALHRVVVTRTDQGQDAFNWSGLLGPLAAEGTANAYLPDRERTIGRTFGRYSTDIGFLAVGNLLREYWPAISKRLGRPKMTGRPDAPIDPPSQ